MHISALGPVVFVCETGTRQLPLHGFETVAVTQTVSDAHSCLIVSKNKGDTRVTVLTFNMDEGAFLRDYSAPFS